MGNVKIEPPLHQKVYFWSILGDMNSDFSQFVQFFWAEIYKSQNSKPDKDFQNDYFWDSKIDFM